ncbi:hypothetical protein AaE_008645, partial [Aphanomyces astaci]
MLLASLGLTLVYAGNHNKLLCNDVEQNIDYPGFDVGSTSQADSSECCNDCAANDDCKVWVWTTYQGGTCWLKSGHGEGVQLDGAVAGSLNDHDDDDDDDDDDSDIEEDTDYEGNDLTSTSRKYAELCTQDCENTDGCKLFVWTNHQGGTCWLKHAKGAKHNVPGARALVLRGDHATTTLQPAYSTRPPKPTTTEPGYSTRAPATTTTAAPATTTAVPQTTTSKPTSTSPAYSTRAPVTTTTAAPATSTKAPTTTATPVITTKTPTTTATPST